MNILLQIYLCIEMELTDSDSAGIAVAARARCQGAPRFQEQACKKDREERAVNGGVVFAFQFQCQRGNSGKRENDQREDRAYAQGGKIVGCSNPIGNPCMFIAA